MKIDPQSDSFARELRASTLQATLQAARTRRWLRRGRWASAVVAVAGLVIAAVQVWDRPGSAPSDAPLPLIAAVQSPPPKYLLKTERHPSLRIQTEKHGGAIVSTIRTAPGEYLVDDTGLGAHFPNRGIAIVSDESDQRRLVVY